MCKVMNARQVGKRPTADRLYVGRPSKWGNPFVIGRDGSRPHMDRPAAGAHGSAARVARQEPRVLVRALALPRGGAD
jgi:hypothetical protein